MPYLNNVTSVSGPALWDDMNFPLSRTYVNPTTSKPDYDTTNLGLLFPQNLTTEKIDIICQLPHSWIEGSRISPHVHIVQSANQPCTFKMDYKWYNLGDPVPVNWTTYTMNTYVQDYVSGSIAQMVIGTGIDGTGLRISSILKIKLYRDDNTYTGDVFTDQFDIHIQKNSHGSQKIGDKY